MLHPAQQNVHDIGLTASLSRARAQSFMPSNPWRRRHVHFGKRSGFADVVALGEVHAVPSQQVHRCGVPDKFSNRLLSKANGHLHDRFNDLLIVSVPGEIADELAVDLEVVERQMLEIMERAEARSEIVQGEGAPQAGKLLSKTAGLRDVPDRDGFGHLEN
jgi:hypothetical protein